MRRQSGVAYGAGYLGIALVTQVVASWIVYFYAPPQDRGLEPLLPIGWIGAAMLIGRLVDAVSDPLVAAWSDRTRSPRGRRLPFMRWSMLPLAATFALLWTPVAEWGTAGVMIYITLMLGAFFAFFTGYVAPYLALLPELAPEPRERVQLSAWQAFFNIVGLAIAMVGSSWLIERHGFGVMGVVLSVVALISFAIPVLRIRETYQGGEPIEGSAWEHFVLTWRNPSFIPYIISQTFFWFGFNMVMVGVPYLVTVVMGGSEGDVGLLLAAAFGVALLCFPVITRLAERRGLKAAQIWSTTWLVGVLLAWGTIGRWPWGSTLLQGVVVVASSGFALAGLFILPNALVAEITDRDFAQTGKRREAIYFGAQGLVNKTTLGLSSGAASLLLEALGYSAETPWGVIAIGPVAAVFVAVGVLTFLRYPASAPHSIQAKG